MWIWGFVFSLLGLYVLSWSRDLEARVMLILFECGIYFRTKCEKLILFGNGVECLR